MLGLIFIYWIGKYFYRLAEKFNQNKWLFAILGVVVYYSSQFIFGVLIAIFNEYLVLGLDLDNVFLVLIGIPIGLLFTYLFYFLLDRNWKKNEVQYKETIQDIGSE
jgi:predicted membrane protein